MHRLTWRVALVTLGTLAALLMVFFLWGDTTERWMEQGLRESAGRPLLIAAVLAGLLAVDIVLPIPSSLVSISAGAMLGPWFGGLASFVGMTIGSAAGYVLGRAASQSFVRRLIRPAEYQRLSAITTRYGSAAILLTRGVPLIAEGAALFAGMYGMPIARFIVVSALANAGISIVYAVVGASLVRLEPALLALAAIAVVVAILVALSGRRRAHHS